MSGFIAEYLWHAGIRNIHTKPIHSILSFLVVQLRTCTRRNDYAVRIQEKGKNSRNVPSVIMYK